MKRGAREHHEHDIGDENTCSFPKNLFGRYGDSFFFSPCCFVCGASTLHIILVQYSIRV